jgi:hypothetical protein
MRLSKLDPFREPAARCQDTSRLDEIGREVDRRHPATAFGRQITRRATEATTEIDYVQAGLYACTFRMLARCRDTAAVQLVERPQITMAGLLRINPGRSERVVDLLHYRPIPVVALNHCLDVDHARFLLALLLMPCGDTGCTMPDTPLSPRPSPGHGTSSLTGTGRNGSIEAHTSVNT